MSMEGVQFIFDSEGEKTSVVINLKKHARLWEDVYDNWLAEQRKHEPRESLHSVRSRLRRKGKLGIVRSKSGNTNA
jgi:hypothetical protein